MVDTDLSRMERFKCGWTKVIDVNVFLSRTGYTGEDGFEVYVWNTSLKDPADAEKVWSTILEAGMCLYGNDITEDTNPLEAGLDSVVKLKKRSFRRQGSYNQTENGGNKKETSGSN